MPRLPKHDYSMSALEEPKLYAVTYVYETEDGWFGDTWNISGQKNIGGALEQVDNWLRNSVDQGNYVSYEIVSVTVIRRGE